MGAAKTLRLSATEHQALAAATREIEGEVFIFGSRVDPNRRGGDIDLLILAPGINADQRYRLSLDVAVAFRMQCDEKIDVVVFDPTNLSDDERDFLSTIDRVAWQA